VDINTPLFALSGQGGGGGGGSTSTINVSTITGNPEFLGNAVYMSQPNSANDGITFVTNAPGPIVGVPASTVGMRFDMGSQVGYIIQNPTGGLGNGSGMNIFANGITLGSSQGVEIAGASGNGAGELIVSSIKVSSINAAAPGGGGVTVSPLFLSSSTYVGVGTGLIPIGTFPAVQDHLYKVTFNVGTVSSFVAPAAGDRWSIVGPDASVQYTALMSDWANIMEHNPRGQTVEMTFVAPSTTAAAEIYYDQNGGAPSTFFGLEQPQNWWVLDFGSTV
jgi:hypothetical protein